MVARKHAGALAIDTFDRLVNEVRVQQPGPANSR
jgi:hypothetical protein